MTDWQPMATAPKDGTGIFATDGERLATFYWEDVSWADPRFWQIGCTAYSKETEVQDYDTTISFEPTHWMKLPPPPKATP